MIGDIFQHGFMIKISICDTFELTKHVFSGSGQMPLNTLNWSTFTAQPRPKKMVPGLPRTAIIHSNIVTLIWSRNNRLHIVQNLTHDGLGIPT